MPTNDEVLQQLDKNTQPLMNNMWSMALPQSRTGNTWRDLLNESFTSLMGLRAGGAPQNSMTGAMTRQSPPTSQDLMLMEGMKSPADMNIAKNSVKGDYLGYPDINPPANQEYAVNPNPPKMGDQDKYNLSLFKQNFDKAIEGAAKDRRADFKDVNKFDVESSIDRLTAYHKQISGEYDDLLLSRGFSQQQIDNLTHAQKRDMVGFIGVNKDFPNTLKGGTDESNELLNTINKAMGNLKEDDPHMQTLINAKKQLLKHQGYDQQLMKHGFTKEHLSKMSIEEKTSILNFIGVNPEE